MRVDLLRIRNLRNIEDAEIQPGKGMNLFFGKNGAGKTSVIEGIYLLGRGRTFRGVSAGPVIFEGRDSLEVFAKARKNGGESKSIGISQTRIDTTIRVDGENIRKLSELARGIPIQIITTQSHDLFDRGPGMRRRFMDWGLFHVEHLYQSWYSRYKRVLDQRNATLKQGRGNTAVWNDQLQENGLTVHGYRKRYVNELVPLFTRVLAEFFNIEDLSVEYYPGWPRDEDFGEALLSSYAQDVKRGHTGVGVHKADLRLRIGKNQINNIISRGQLKIVASSMLISQAILLTEKTGESPIILFDDISAELDKDNLHRLLGLLSRYRFQVFLNSTENILDNPITSTLGDSRMFHVEHGNLTLVK